MTERIRELEQQVLLHKRFEEGLLRIDFETGNFHMVVNTKLMGTEIDIFRWYLLTVTNEEIDFAFSVSIMGEMKTGRSEKMKRLILGLGNVPFLRRVSEVSKIMTQMRMIYADYPDSPNGLENWRARLPPLYQAVKHV